MDRGYLDFEWLYSVHEAGGRFVILAMKNLQFYRKLSTAIDRQLGLQCDQSGPKTKLQYPQMLRRVHLVDYT